MTSSFEEGPKNSEEGTDPLAQLETDIANLQPGGPAPSYPLIIAYIDGDLNGLDKERERKAVEGAIGRWRPWFDAFLEMNCASNPINFLK